MGGLTKLRIEPGDAGESWKRSQGRTVAERFPLISYLAGSDESAVFLTSFSVPGGAAEPAAIKLIYAAAADAGKQLQHWKSAHDLNHPNLLRIFEAGRCELEGMQLLYVVEEYAEENLSQSLPERALSPEETRELLPPVLGALEYLHDHGFAHANLRPSNIFAIADQVKLSTDDLLALGEKGNRSSASGVYDPPEGPSTALLPAADIWQVGVTLIEVLTQHVPTWDGSRSKTLEVSKSMPEPFREIAKHCLTLEPEKRWTTSQILACLELESASTHAAPKPAALTLVQSEVRQPEPARGVAAGNAGSTDIAANKKEEQEAESSSPSQAQASKIAPPKLPYPAAYAQHRPSVRWPYVMLLAAMVVVAGVLILRTKPSIRTSTINSPQPSGAIAVPSQNTIAQAPLPDTPHNPQSEVSGNPSNPVAANPGTTSAARASTEAANTEVGAPAEQGIIHRVVPDVSPGARRTIHGRILVRVKVRVDEAGNVTKAAIQSGPGSKYFSRLSLDAARDWKFSPQPSSRESEIRQWNLQFAYTRAKTEASATESR